MQVEDFSSSADSESSQRNPITLTMLFYALTLAAILAACYRYVAIEESGTAIEYGVSIAIGGFAGLMIGVITIFRRNSHPWMAPVVGLCMGMLLGPMLRIQLTHFGSIIAVSFTGSWLLVLIMAISAKLNQHRF